jgi:putative ABC transport system permease protein
LIPVAYNLGSLSARRTTTATAVLGIALVVFVLAGALMLSSGVARTLGRSGRDDVAMVIRKGSDAEISSNIEIASVGLILDGPEVKRNAAGAPLGVGEVVVVAALEKLGTDGIANVNIRGVPENVYDVRPTVPIVEGRRARPGTDEAVAGARIRGRFAGVELGRSVELRKGRPVTIVGIFEDGGSAFESEIWTDDDTLRTSFGREGLASSVRAQLTSAAAFDDFKKRVESDKRLGCSRSSSASSARS